MLSFVQIYPGVNLTSVTGNRFFSTALTLASYCIVSSSAIYIEGNYTMEGAANASNQAIYLFNLSPADAAKTIVKNNSFPTMEFFINEQILLLRDNITNSSLPELFTATTLILYEETAANDDIYRVLGPGTITDITNARIGQDVQLLFTDGAVVNDTGNVNVNGTFTGFNGSTLTLRYDFGQWWEISRVEFP